MEAIVTQAADVEIQFGAHVPAEVAQHVMQWHGRFTDYARKHGGNRILVGARDEQTCRLQVAGQQLSDSVRTFLFLKGADGWHIRVDRSRAHA